MRIFMILTRRVGTGIVGNLLRRQRQALSKWQPSQTKKLPYCGTKITPILS